MNVKQWIRRLKSVRARARKTSPKARQIAAVSIVVMLSVAGIVIVAKQSNSSASTGPTATPRAAAATASVKESTSTKTRPASGKSANAATSSAQASEVVTLAGCLEQSHDTFKLKDTEGADAPKSRNWKTGFITKHASSITVTDSGNRLKLGSHVGERVSLTGLLSDKEMQGRSLKKLDGQCD